MDKVVQELKLMNKKSKDQSSSGGEGSSNEDKGVPKEKKEKNVDGSVGNAVQGRWHREEHLRFIEAIKKHGKDWKSVEQFIETRSGSQIRSHAQKFFNRIIKKYQIDKTEVINFIQNRYESPQSSESTTPQKKKRGDKDNELDNGVSFGLKNMLPVAPKLKELGTDNKPSKNGSPGPRRFEAAMKDENNSVSNAGSIQSNEGEQPAYTHKARAGYRSTSLTEAWATTMSTLANLVRASTEDLKTDSKHEANKKSRTAIASTTPSSRPSS